MSARLEVIDPTGRRMVPLEEAVTTLGRRTECHVRLSGTDVSRDHAEIVRDGERYLIRDRGSRFGTFVNGEQIAGEHPLKHGDAVRLGQANDSQVIFQHDSGVTASVDRATSAVGDLRQVAALLEGLRALGSGRVLDEVLAMVIDSAIEVASAERGFIMLAGADHALEFKLGRARGRVTLPGKSFETSRKIPEQVFETGEARIVADLLDGDLANAHMGTVALGIRHVLCVPLVLVRYVEQAEADLGQRRIGVLYLDSRERGSILSPVTRGALETLATEAAVAIENARLYREAAEKTRLEQELKIAAEIQQALMPDGERRGAFFEAVGTSVPCRAIGGDFFEHLDLPDGRLGFALGDVSGKGAPAALLTAMVQGMFTVLAATSAGPAEALSQINQGMKRRSVESRFVTMFYAVLGANGALTYSNAGHNAPVVVKKDAVLRLETGGMVLGLFDFATYAQDDVQLDAGDTVVVFSDGFSEAASVDGEEYGDDRLIACLEANRGATPAVMREALIASVRQFTAGAAQGDDMTVLIVRYGSQA
jgi:serine phosphatase RsbU (regulator of sigma subunit)